MTFFECPAYTGARATTPCGLPAEVELRYTVESSDGPLESARIRCPRGHWFNGALESLTPPEIHRPQSAGTAWFPVLHRTVVAQMPHLNDNAPRGPIVPGRNGMRAR
jgi:hypothetical protein